MENIETPSTPMGRVWSVVLLSMCFTLGASWLWHTSGMHTEEARYRAVDDAVMQETMAITQYRDVLKERGKDAAAAYLATSSQNIYGN